MTWDQMMLAHRDAAIGADWAAAADAFVIGAWVIHKPTEARRYVTGIRGDVLHLSQVIKLADGETFYWCTREEVVLLG